MGKRRVVFVLLIFSAQSGFAGEWRSVLNSVNGNKVPQTDELPSLSDQNLYYWSWRELHLEKQEVGTLDPSDPSNVQRYVDFTRARFIPYIDEIKRRIENDLIEVPKGVIGSLNRDEGDKDDALVRKIRKARKELKNHELLSEEARKAIGDFVRGAKQEAGIKRNPTVLFSQGQAYRKAKEGESRILQEMESIEQERAKLFAGAQSRAEREQRLRFIGSLRGTAGTMDAHIENGELQNSLFPDRAP